MLRIVLEMDMNLEEFKQVHFLANNTCQYVTPAECGSENYCAVCDEKYKHRIPRIISIDNVSKEKI